MTERRVSAPYPLDDYYKPTGSAPAKFASTANRHSILHGFFRNF
jgi:hypothetical protein